MCEVNLSYTFLLYFHFLVGCKFLNIAEWSTLVHVAPRRITNTKISRQRVTHCMYIHCRLARPWCKPVGLPIRQADGHVLTFHSYKRPDSGTVIFDVKMFEAKLWVIHIFWTSSFNFSCADPRISPTCVIWTAVISSNFPPSPTSKLNNNNNFLRPTLCSL